jgi:hypothetical protein
MNNWLFTKKLISMWDSKRNSVFSLRYYCFSKVFMDEFSKFFDIFCCFSSGWSASTFIIFNWHLRPSLKHECHSITAVGLKNVLQKPHEAVQWYWQWMYRSSHKVWRRHVAQFCHRSQTKRNTKSKRYSCKNNACSQRDVTWQTDAIGFRKCDLGHPSHLLSPRQLQK